MSRTNNDKRTQRNGQACLLTLAALAQAKRLPAAFLRELGLSDHLQGGVGIPYRGPTGEDIAVKRRTALKATEGSYWPKGTPLAAYGSWRIDRANRAGFLILVEGESDCWALWHHDLPVLGLPGAGAARTLEREQVESVGTVYVHREPDAGGRQFVEGVCRRLADLGFTGEVFELRMPQGVKDPADLHARDPEGFKAALEEAIRASAPIELSRPADRDGRGEAPAGAPSTKKLRTLEPYRPFPTAALPAPVGEYVRQGALALGCDPAYLALPALAVAAGLIGFTRVLLLKRTWRAVSVLWTLVVAYSGYLKTPAFRMATDYLFTLQRRLDADYKRQLAEYSGKKEKWEAETKAAKAGKGEPAGDPPEPPTQRTVFTSDATIEAIAELIGDNPRGLIVPCDELAGWLGSFMRYKGKAGGTDLPRWLSMHSAGGFAYHRKTGDRRRIVVPHAALSIAGGIQPDILARALAGEFLESGLAGRLHMAQPPRPAKVWTEMEIDPDTEKRYHKLLDSLYALEFHGGKPHVLRLTPEAKAVWVGWYEAWGREQAAAEGELAAAFSKLEEAAARFALLHHVATRLGRGESDLCPVEAESMYAGVELARWFAHEARRVYAILSESEQERDTRHLVEFVQARGGRITTRALQRSNSRKYPTAEVAQAALEGLVQAGLASWEEPAASAQGGQPARHLRLRPTHDSTDTTDGPSGDDDDGPSDTTPDTTLPTPGFSGELRGSVGTVMRRAGEADAGPAKGAGAVAAGSTVGKGDAVSDGVDPDGHEDGFATPFDAQLATEPDATAVERQPGEEG
jgi:hypothetical protein